MFVTRYFCRVNNLKRKIAINSLFDFYIAIGTRESKDII